MRQKEVAAGVGKFLRGGVRANRRIEHPPRRDPPVGVAFAVYVSTLVCKDVVQLDRGQFAAV